MTPADRRLLRAALLSGDDARDAWGQWRAGGGDLDRVAPATFRLLPVLYRSLEAAGIEDRDLPRLKGIYRHAWVLNRRHEHALAPGLDALARAEVPALLLGGPALVAAHYRDGGARRIDDVALLVAPADAERALAVLRGTGLSALEAGARPDGPVTLATADGHRLQLRRRALPAPGGDDDQWAGAIPARFGTVSVRVPGPAEQLLHACARGARAREADPVWIADVAVILRSAGPQVDWQRLIDGAATRRLALATAAALTTVRDLLGPAAVPVPRHVDDRLRGWRHVARERVARRAIASLQTVTRRSRPAREPLPRRPGP